jgi:hypothetical protein
MTPARMVPARIAMTAAAAAGILVATAPNAETAGGAARTTARIASAAAMGFLAALAAGIDQ